MAWKGHEAISEPYRFEVGLLLKNDEELDTEKAVGARATLSIATPGGTPHAIHGKMVQIELLHAWAEQTLYRVRLAPLLWNRTLGRHSRVFVDKSPTEILSLLLKDFYGWDDDDLELRLTRDYPKYAHICQYRESDFQFLSRWMEREGLYYYFEHGDGDREKLVITDDLGKHDSSRSEAVRYLPGSSGDHMAGEALDSLRRSHTRVTEWVSLQDYDDLNPPLDVYADAHVTDVGVGDRWEYGPNVLTPEAAARLAKVRAEEHRAHEITYQGSGRVLGLRSGYTFAVEQHPRAEMNGQYLVTRLEHQGIQSAASAEVRRLLDLEEGDEYRVRVGAIRADLQFRAPSKTPRPRVHGVERGFVDGPAESEYAQIDEHGRYRVKIHLDEMQWEDSPAPDGQYSTWLRMLQPHGGTPEGFHFPLHKGTEVAIVFLGGDPDRPVIAGVAPNAATPSPVTSANKSLNVIQTHIGNRIELDDDVDKPCIRIICPNPSRVEWGSWGTGDEERGVHIVADQKDGPNGGPSGGHLAMEIAGKSKIDVAGTQDETIHGNVTETYFANQTTTITGNHTLGAASELVDIGTGGRDVHVAGGVIEVFKGGHHTEVTGPRESIVTGPVTHQFAATLTESVTGAVTQTYSATQVFTVGGAQIQTISGPQTSTVGGPATHTYGGPLTEMIGGARICIAGGAIVNVAPSIQNLQPAHDATNAKWFTAYGFKWSAGGVAIDVVAAKLAAVGVSISGGGFKMDSTYASVAFSAQSTTVCGMKFSANGAETTLAGIFTIL